AGVAKYGHPGRHFRTPWPRKLNLKWKPMGAVLKGQTYTGSDVTAIRPSQDPPRASAALSSPRRLYC
ncbi:hypothetical protein ABHI18_010983, partial [Aspergillus niger]